MKYRSTVPLNSAPDARPEARVGWRLTPELQRLCDDCGIFPGDTMAQTKLRIEEHMKRLNDDQRRKLILRIGALLK